MSKKEKGEFFKALNRVQKKYDAYNSGVSRRRSWLRWAIDLTQTDIAELSEGDWVNLSYESAMFILEPVNNPYTESQAGLEGFDFEIWVGSIGAASGEEMSELQRQIKEKLDRFFEKGEFTAKIETDIRILRREDDAGNTWVALTQGQRKGSFLGAAIYTFCLLLAEFGSMTRKCVECHRIYLADRIDQVYCSTKCLNRATQRRFRATKRKKYQSKSRANEKLIAGKPRQQ